MIDFLIGIDQFIFLMINNTLSNPVFDVFFPYITKMQNWYIPILVILLIFLIKAKNKKQAGIVIGLAILTVAIADPLCVRVLKPFFHRFRPCHPSYFQDGKHLFLTGGHFFFGEKTSLSLPSAHAMNNFAQAMHLALWYPAKKIWFFTIASLVALSRVYVGVHYPFDILLGSLLGIGVGAFVYFTYAIIHNAISRQKNVVSP